MTLVSAKNECANGRLKSSAELMPKGGHFPGHYRPRYLNTLPMQRTASRSTMPGNLCQGF